MVAYTVHEPAQPTSHRVERAAEMVFVKDGFSWAAFIFTPIWMIAQGLWLVLAGYVGVSVLLGLALWATGANAGVEGVVYTALDLLVGFEAANLMRWTLERRGWREVGVVSGLRLGECERRFFDGWFAGQPGFATAAAQGGRSDRDGGTAVIGWPRWSFPTWRR